jgi:hypothetical protein
MTFRMPCERQRSGEANFINLATAAKAHEAIAPPMRPSAIVKMTVPWPSGVLNQAA